MKQVIVKNIHWDDNSELPKDVKVYFEDDWEFDILKVIDTISDDYDCSILEYGGYEIGDLVEDD